MLTCSYSSFFLSFSFWQLDLVLTVDLVHCMIFCHDALFSLSQFSVYLPSFVVVVSRFFLPIHNYHHQFFSQLIEEVSLAVLAQLV